MKNTILGIIAAFIFLGLALFLTKVSSAEPESEPATPITPTTEAGHATGGVKAMDGDMALKLNFNAHQGPVKGEVLYSDSSGTKFKGEVNDCYFQQDNQAVFAGEVSKGNVSEKYFVVQVQDNGEGKKATGPDMLSVNLTDTLPTCTLEATLSAEVNKGNLQVHAN